MNTIETYHVRFFYEPLGFHSDVDLLYFPEEKMAIGIAYHQRSMHNGDKSVQILVYKNQWEIDYIQGLLNTNSIWPQKKGELIKEFLLDDVSFEEIKQMYRFCSVQYGKKKEFTLTKLFNFSTQHLIDILCGYEMEVKNPICLFLEMARSLSPVLMDQASVLPISIENEFNIRSYKYTAILQLR